MFLLWIVIGRERERIKLGTVLTANNVEINENDVYACERNKSIAIETNLHIISDHINVK